MASYIDLLLHPMLGLVHDFLRDIVSSGWGWGSSTPDWGLGSSTGNWGTGSSTGDFFTGSTTP
ncbi:hypothetical protein ACWDSJ_07400 [Nocardia sp. NPDC003482]